MNRVDEVTTGTRTVLVLGRRPGIEWNGVRERVRSELFVLSLGYPITKAQRTALLTAQELAAEIGVWFDALLVLSEEEARSQVRRRR